MPTTKTTTSISNVPIGISKPLFRTRPHQRSCMSSFPPSRSPSYSQDHNRPKPQQRHPTPTIHAQNACAEAQPHPPTSSTVRSRKQTPTMRHSPTSIRVTHAIQSSTLLWMFGCLAVMVLRVSFIRMSRVRKWSNFDLRRIWMINLSLRRRACGGISVILEAFLDYLGMVSFVGRR
ncbi:hypothetical protein BDV96DRAFT_566125 [Lophiotrema nucula]|uniref:Uncharacterized protein n=1 Tax=Lophiotrema nucula TaxID=690887 RepID=A0A6A5ZNM8_9PLEO|nr:hypothetical protein BDV96DRAFT_566125 [Lophiotrema nucula]